MELQTTTRQFIEDLQSHFGRKLKYPEEVGILIDQTTARSLDQPFRDAIFHAKFATKTKEVMNRIGSDGEGFDKLAAEFQASIEKASALLKTIVKESPDGIKQHFVQDFFSLDQARFAHFIGLLEDLSWVKNWEVDGKPLPIAARPIKTAQRPAREQLPGDRGAKPSADDLARIRTSAALGIVLMILLLLVDPPVMILGWGLAIVVVSLLLYIAVASNTFLKKSKTSV